MHQAVKKVLVTEEEIIKRCKELGKQIKNDYESKVITIEFRKTLNKDIVTKDVFEYIIKNEIY